MTAIPNNRKIDGRSQRQVKLDPATGGGDVYLAGDNDFTGENDFENAPTSQEDASSANELVRLSQVPLVETIDIELTTLNVYQVFKTFDIDDVLNVRVSAVSLDEEDVSYMGVSISKAYDGIDSIMRKYLGSGSNMNVEVDLNGVEIRAAITGSGITLPHNVRIKLFHE